jgi:hypothetical protein
MHRRFYPMRATQLGLFSVSLDDGAAKLEAEEYYRNHAARPTFTSFFLCSDGGRFVYQSPAKSS